jgi:DNA-binding CsgD family transcriptional regulator
MSGRPGAAARHAVTSFAPAEAQRHLERALEIWPRVPDAAERTGVDQAEVARLAGEAAYVNISDVLEFLGRHDEAVQAAREGIALVGRVGLARFGLTEREREILVLLAAGRSNPQIAGALFISPKTASVHVSNILAKLGVASRVEAAAVAHRLGVTG